MKTKKVAMLLLTFSISCNLLVFAGGLDDVANVAERQVGVRRSEGGTTPQRGFDCSGLTQYCYRQGADIDIGRTTQIQRRKGRIVGRDGLSRGDLVFFYSGWSHVGIYAGNGQVIHSGSKERKVVKVRIWGDFAGGVKVIENVSRFIMHPSTEFSRVIRQAGCSQTKVPHNNLCVDAAAENNKKVQLWEFFGNPNQRWDFVRVKGEDDAFFIGIKAGFLNGGNAFLTGCSEYRLTYEPFRDAKEQQWKLIKMPDNHYLVQNVATKRYLDSGPHDKNHFNGGEVYTNTRYGADQEWLLTE